MWARAHEMLQHWLWEVSSVCLTDPDLFFSLSSVWISCYNLNSPRSYRSVPTLDPPLWETYPPCRTSPSEFLCFNVGTNAQGERMSSPTIILPISNQRPLWKQHVSLRILDKVSHLFTNKNLCSENSNNYHELQTRSFIWFVIFYLDKLCDQYSFVRLFHCVVRLI